MFDVTKKSMQWGEETLTLETGKVARQADGTVIATLGETSVMANVTFAKEQKPGQDFFPLTVHYQEKYYAAGKIPGGFFKREARPTEKETLTARLIDRPIRPLFVARLQERSAGDVHRAEPRSGQRSRHRCDDRGLGCPDHLRRALHGARSPVPALAFEDGEYVLNPTVDDMQDLRLNPEQRLDLVVAGTKDAVMMVESEAYELTEAEMLGAVTFAHEQIQPVIDLIIDLAEEAAKEPFEFQAPDYAELYDAVKAAGEEQMRAAYAITDKQERTAAVAAAREAILGSADRRAAGRREPGLRDEKARSRHPARRRGQERPQADRRSRPPTRSVPSWPKPRCCPEPTVPPSSPAAKLRRWLVTTLGTGDDEQFIDALRRQLQIELPAALQLPALLGW